MAAWDDVRKTCREWGDLPAGEEFTPPSEAAVRNACIALDRAQAYMHAPPRLMIDPSEGEIEAIWDIDGGYALLCFEDKDIIAVVEHDGRYLAMVEAHFDDVEPMNVIEGAMKTIASYQAEH